MPLPTFISMTERLLQYIWQFQHFNRNDLETVSGDKLVIIDPGQTNSHQGPDFLCARIKIGADTWAGSVELHMQASGWNSHGHSGDSNYHNVILHVVWMDDDPHPVHGIPTLVLEGRISGLLLQQYQNWMNSGWFIPCAENIHLADEIVWSSWTERLLIERLQRKHEEILRLLSLNNSHWEETFWWLLARSFGLYVNADAFDELGRSIPCSLLSKHRNQIHQLEALLLGQAGLLNDHFEEQYPLMLQKEYLFISKKYRLSRISIPLHFLRMRPAGFPTIRLAQLAMLIHQTTHLFSSVLQSSDNKEIQTLLNVTANDYWHYHFVLGTEASYQPKVLGAQMVNNVLINCIVPILFSYGKYHGNEAFIQKALDWLIQLPSEKNVIIRPFLKLGIANKNAFTSQALIELKTFYCNNKKCLDCAVGNTILKRKFT